MMRRFQRSVMAVCAAVAVAGSFPAHAGTFEDALAATYAHNPRIAAERQRLQGTDENVAQAASGFRPSINANYERGRQRTDFNNTGNVNSTAETKALRAEQPLFRGGGTLSALRSARQLVEAGQHELAALEQQVLLEAITAYMDVMATSAIVDLSRTNAAVLDQQLKGTNTRFQVGEVTRTDVAQAQARRSEAETAVVVNEGQLINALAAFERVAGYRPEGTLTVPDAFPELPASLDEALIRSHASNPQLLAAIHTAKSSHEDVRSNEATLLPRVSLVGTLSRQDGVGATGSSSFDQDKVAVEVAIPLYQSGAEYSRVREAAAIARQRDAQTLDTRLAIDQSVTQAWQRLETATAIIGTRQNQITAAEVALDGVKQEQQYGSRTVLDVLDAEQELFTARTNLVRAQRDRVVAAFTLALTLGQLTPATLNLDVPAYDPKAHAAKVEWKPIGF